MRFISFSGIVDYEEARGYQLKLVEERARDLIPDTILFLEHAPVITRGRGLQFTGKPGPRQMPLPAKLPPEIQFCETERGGDLTYHGPGQLVIYPICKLDGSGFGPARDVGGFIRKLESVLIDVLAEDGLQATTRENATGVWVGDRKIVSVGIAVRKWVTYHGAAMNCVNDMSPFRLISPCGFQSEVMANLTELLGRTAENWREELEKRIVRKLTPLASQSAKQVQEFLSGRRVFPEIT